MRASAADLFVPIWSKCTCDSMPGRTLTSIQDSTPRARGRTNPALHGFKGNKKTDLKPIGHRWNLL